jgi:N-acetylmuramoyl-L-alanine amidase
MARTTTIRAARVATGSLMALALLAGCQDGAAPARSATGAGATTSSTPSTPSTSPATPISTPTPTPTRTATPKPTPAPVIVLDPGHSPTIHAIDSRTKLNVSDYENEPEMRDVFAVAKLVRAKLVAAGYRVVMTKTNVRQRVSLAKRAAIANKVHAALALSIHDQAGANGGIGFNRGNNTVYYQSVGDYRTNIHGTKIRFRDKRVAALSRKFGQVFRAERQRVEHHRVALRSNVGYNLGSRGLAAGNIWMVQLLSHVPWVYDEAGGNSAGRIGLSAGDKRKYANALVAAVERCVPKPRR